MVSLLDAVPADGLSRGQVGVVMERLGHDTSLVEFSDEQGRPYIIVTCSNSNLKKIAPLRR